MEVLIVDDSADIREILKKIILAVKGIKKVSEASSFSEANVLLNESLPDAAIIDIQLPDGSGIEILKSIKASGKKIVVMMLSNYTSAPYRTKCKAEKADYFFDKTTEFNHITNVLESLSRNWQVKSLAQSQLNAT